MLKLYTELQNRLAEIRNGDDEGATMVEYALMVSLVAVALITVVGLMSDGIGAAFQSVADALTP